MRDASLGLADIAELTERFVSYSSIVSPHDRAGGDRRRPPDAEIRCFFPAAAIAQ